MRIVLPEFFDALVFDFDGTLVLSNQLKEDSYIQLASLFEGGVKRVIELLRQKTPIGDRYSLFKEFVKYAIDNQTFTNLGKDELFNFLCDEYTKLTFKKVSTAESRKGSVNVLKQLKMDKIQAFIISGTPEESLKPIVEARGLSSLFNATLGGPNNKYQNLEIISRDFGIPKSRFIIVGDGEDDFEYASAACCGFIGVKGGSLMSKVDILIDDYCRFNDMLRSCRPLS